MPDDLDLPPARALDLAQQLLDTGRPFSAHEVLEAVWKAAPQPERELWRGLAQLAVGVTHLERGNRRGAQALLRRGATALADFRGSAPHGVAVDRLIEQSRLLAERVGSGAEPAHPPPLQLRDPT